MFKKILITSTLLMGCHTSVFAGLYVGPSLNYESISSNGLRYEGLRPMIVAGYGNVFRSWLYFAMEAFLGSKSIDINNKSGDGISLRTSYAYGGSFIPGVFLDDQILGYIRLGLISTKFTQLDIKKSGYEAGLGIEAKMIDCWNIRAEYDYVSYNSIAGLGHLKAGEYNLAVIYRF